MGWLLKSAKFKVLSALPGARSIYHFLQEKVTHSTVATRERVDQKVNVAVDFCEWLQTHGRLQQLVTGRVLDYGAGWHPTIPIVWYAVGNDRQTLVDITPNMDAGKVNDAIRIVLGMISESNWRGRPFLKRFPEQRIVATQDPKTVLTPMGIEYCAPYQNLLVERAGQYDIVACTQVFQHVSKTVLPGLYKEIFTCLKSGGLFHATIHFVGHFGSPFSRQGHYEHLKYSPETWERWINSSLMSFNRLKAPDYREALDQAGFKILEFKLTEPTDDDMAELKRTPVHPSFSRYTDHELATLGVSFVAEKP